MLDTTGLSVELGERVYDDTSDSPEHVRHVSEMPLPKGMDALRQKLHEQSHLLPLCVGASSENLYDAYGHDLELLLRYREACIATIRAAVRARSNDAEAYLRSLIASIYDIVHLTTLDLGSEALQLDNETLRVRLQRQFQTDVDSLMISVATWMHLLVEENFIGAVDWYNPRALRYHFFVTHTSRRELGREQSTTGDFVQGRTTTTTTEKEVEVVGERRVHTVVNANVHTLDAYTQRVPERIARLVDEIPPILRPFVTIISGTVSEETTHRETISKEVTTERHTVFIPDPAVAIFGAWTLSGWGGSLEENAKSVYGGHALSRANTWLVAECVVALVLSLLASLEGPRVGFLMMVICAILIGCHQASLRINRKRT